MRSPRTIVTLLAVALAASLAATAPAASARDAGSTARAAEVTRAAAPAQRAEARTVTAKVVKKQVRPGGPKRLVLTGTVNPPKGPVYIQRGTKCNKAKETCNFKFYSKVFLKKGRYQAVIDAPPKLRGWVWRARVNGETTAFSDVWVTCTKRASQSCKVPY